MSDQDYANALPPGFMLEEYRIERVLGMREALASPTMPGIRT